PGNARSVRHGGRRRGVRAVAVDPDRVAAGWRSLVQTAEELGSYGRGERRTRGGGCCRISPSRNFHAVAHEPLMLSARAVSTSPDFHKAPDETLMTRAENASCRRLELADDNRRQR